MSIRNAASQFTSASKRLDILICNAGVMAIPTGLTEDGYEVQFGINYLSHALLTELLLPTLKRTAKEQGDARVISIASLGASHTPSGGIAFDSLKSTQDDLGITSKWMRYGQSKLANILYASELAKRHPWLTTASLEPGTVWTSLLSNLGWVDRMFLIAATWGKTVPLYEGTYNTCWAATAEKSGIESGKMYKPVGVKVKGIQYINDEDLAGRLWVWTEKELENFQLK
jgi:NAD(P)-dependent dehydrogenase (short-subunit alcohol dehydrogenase family)